MFEIVLQVLDHDTAVDVPDPGMIPDGNATLENLIAAWDKSRIELYKFLESCRRKIWATGITPPRDRSDNVGQMPASTCLSFSSSSSAYQSGH